MKNELDSVILIDHFNGIEPATSFIIENFNQCAVSAITYAEVLTGFEPDSSAFYIATTLLDQFTFLNLDKQIALETSKQRKLTRLKLPDASQLAFAIRHDLPLATRNTKNFKIEKFPFLIVPYQF
ncbi:MAG: PIN domain-containing protein [Acinetobacter populi]|uniref:PIN domain-containing protein n=1 Tax=Acinetobacter populi TaxID=1582270 RepID=UPI00235389EF|nr:PIN domain-containing protein [Acinetobacter populi]MCH4247058.1 PIN domain-containing protein [Acinetobacter populi]